MLLAVSKEKVPQPSTLSLTDVSPVTELFVPDNNTSWFTQRQSTVVHIWKQNYACIVDRKRFSEAEMSLRHIRTFRVGLDT